MERSPHAAGDSSGNKKVSLRFVEGEGSLSSSRGSRHLYLSIKPTPSQPIYFISILILFSHLRLGLPGDLYSPLFPTKTLFEPLLLLVRATCHHPSLFDSSNGIWWGVEIMKLLLMQFSRVSCYLVPNIFVRTLLLENPQRTLFPQYERPRFTPIQNNSKIIVLLQFIN